MSDQNDDTQNFALLVLAGLLAMVVAGVLTLAISTGLHRSSGSAAPMLDKPAAPQTSAAADTVEPEGRIYFELGSDTLPANAAEVLAKVADAARTQSNKVVLISGFHDESGDAAKNAELAKNRAMVVRHALEANGVAPDHLVMDKPTVTTGGTDAREARRVEMRLR